MRRFLLPDLPADLGGDGGTEVDLAGADGRHLARVLRARPGDRVRLFDGRGREVEAEVVGVSRDAARLVLLADVTSPRPRRDVTLLCAVPRGDRMDWLVEKCVEAGVARVVPVAFARSVRQRAGAGRLRRWRRRAEEATKQCGRADVPVVEDVTGLVEALTAAPRPLLAADPGAADPLEPLAGEAAAVAVVIGPEGGPDPAESAILAAAGAVPFALGDLILRVETAALLAVHRLAW